MHMTAAEVSNFCAEGGLWDIWACKSRSMLFTHLFFGLVCHGLAVHHFDHKQLAILHMYVNLSAKQ